MKEYYLANYGIDIRLNLVSNKLFELTESETDPELIDYNNYLLDTIDEAIQCIKKFRKSNDEGYDNIIVFGTKAEVKQELINIAYDNNMNLEQLIRVVLDDFILNLPS